MIKIKQKIFVMVLLVLFVICGCSELNRETEKDPVKNDIGTFIGFIDNHSIEIKISGIPEEMAFKSFELTDELKDNFKFLGVNTDDLVHFAYYENNSGQRVLTSIESIENEIGEKRKIREGSSFFLYDGPQPEILSLPQGEVLGGTEIEILEKRDEWIKVKQDEYTGWLPKWYIFEDEEETVRDVNGKYLLLNKEVSGLLYPDGPKIVELKKGKLLNPIKEWEDWFYVGIIVYDIPAVQTAWIPRSALSPLNKTEAIEGFLNKGSTIYQTSEFDSIESINAEKTNHDMTVYFTERRDNYVLVNAAGGWSAWTKMENIRFSY